MQSPKGITLVIGGTRSGKSRYAEKLADVGLKDKVYLATAEAGDAEMKHRIQLHRDRRGDDWTTVEEPLALAAAIEAHTQTDTFMLVDCLTLWLTNLLLAGRDIEKETARLIDVLATASGTIVLVSNEVGQGIVPDNALARTFRDEAGKLNQRIADVANRVVLVTAGLPLALKGELSDA